MTFYDDSSSQNGDLLSTCVWNGSAEVGTTFAGGFYLDVMASFDSTMAGDHAFMAGGLDVADGVVERRIGRHWSCG
jgi:hypothetical protein